MYSTYSVPSGSDIYFPVTGSSSQEHANTRPAQRGAAASPGVSAAASTGNITHGIFGRSDEQRAHTPARNESSPLDLFTGLFNKFDLSALDFGDLLILVVIAFLYFEDEEKNPLILLALATVLL